MAKQWEWATRFGSWKAEAYRGTDWLYVPEKTKPKVNSGKSRGTTGFISSKLQRAPEFHSWLWKWSENRAIQGWLKMPLRYWYRPPHISWSCESCSVVSDSDQARILEWIAMPSPADLPDPGVEPGSPALQVDSLPPEQPHTSLLCKQAVALPLSSDWSSKF